MHICLYALCDCVYFYYIPILLRNASVALLTLCCSMNESLHKIKYMVSHNNRTP